MKYIRFEKVGLVMFPATQQHSDIAKLIGDKPLSAGFCVCRGDRFTACGGSTSLNLATHPEDHTFIREALAAIP